MPDPSVSDAYDALARVVASEEFAATPRLKEFLTWVVDEWAAGRVSSISGKAIAIEVYGRDAAADESGLNLVRVEARRLRRRLERYYDGPGREDPFRIRIAKGGYAPQFDANETLDIEDGNDSSPPRPKSRLRAVIGAAIFLLLAGGLLVIEEQVRHGEAPQSRTAAAEREALGSRSMVSLQAVNLASQARNLLFPVFDFKQQDIALSMFRHVIELDPGLHHGYAGAAQVLSIVAFLDPDPVKAQSYLEEAELMAAMALDRAPTDPWAIGASAVAVAVGGELEEAMQKARLAVEIAPEDGHVLDLAGITSIIAGDGAFAAKVSAPGRPRSDIPRFGANNLWGVSSYMVGDYDEAVRAFAGAAEAGASISAPSLVFLAVACDHAGQSEQAEAAVRELEKSWPSFPFEFVVRRLFVNEPAYADDIIDRLGKYGYQARR